MRSRLASVMILALAVTGCGREAAESASATAASQPAASPAPAPVAGTLDIRGTSSEALCERLVPADLQVLGVSDRWSADRKMVHRKLYGESRVSCAWEGFDPARRTSSATTYFKIEVECGKDAATLCADKKASLRPGLQPYEETVEGALCHTLSVEGSNNWVITRDGCFVILYKAQPDIMGIAAEERARRVRETKLAVARAVVANMK